MTYDARDSTDVSRYGRKQEAPEAWRSSQWALAAQGTRLLEPPGEPREPDWWGRQGWPLLPWRLREPAIATRGRLAFLANYGPRRGFDCRPAVHTAAGSFFLRELRLRGPLGLWTMATRALRFGWGRP